MCLFRHRACHTTDTQQMAPFPWDGAAPPGVAAWPGSRLSRDSGLPTLSRITIFLKSPLCGQQTRQIYACPQVQPRFPHMPHFLPRKGSRILPWASGGARGCMLAPGGPILQRSPVCLESIPSPPGHASCNRPETGGVVFSGPQPSSGEDGREGIRGLRTRRGNLAPTELGQASSALSQLPHLSTEIITVPPVAEQIL